jgi:putative ABC transport system permease protein
MAERPRLEPGWVLRMAWRDSRGSRRRLLLFLSAMVLGIAALVALHGVGANLRRGLDAQARMLLGADLRLERDAPFDELSMLLDSLGGQQAQVVYLASMAYFPRTGHVRLVSVRAVEGIWPLYGQLQTDPPEAAIRYLQGGGALVDGTLLDAYDIHIGDSIRIGRRSYPIFGRLVQTSSESAIMALAAPRVFVPLTTLDPLLLGFGSRAQYGIYFRFDEGRDVEALGKQLRNRLRSLRVGVNTVEEIRENWDEAFRNLYRFLGLIGFIALILGGIGVGSSINVYVRQRLDQVAVLRCLGATPWATFSIYLAQALAMGVVGGVLGTLLGLGVQTVFPHLLADFLPFEVVPELDRSAVLLGLVGGPAITLLFALLPLLPVRRVTPLRALQATVAPVPNARDLLYRATWLMLLIGLIVFAMAEAPEPWMGFVYALGLILVLGALTLLARGLTSLLRRIASARWPYVFRQGLANLYRPNNQTVVLMLALGLGVFLVVLVLLIERTLLAQVQRAGGGERPDLVFFDVQPDQRDSLRQLIEAYGVSVVEEVPIVTMRLAEVNGRRIAEQLADTTARLGWAFRREYRSSYRDYLSNTETLIAGTFTPAVTPGTTMPPVSLEEEIATELGVTLGDTLVWDVQGVEIPTVVGSLRRVDWRRFQTNFFVLFPRGVLEDAPQMFVLLVRAGAASPRIQRAAIEAFPSVSAIDLRLILQVAEEIFQKVGGVLHFMALFSVLTGIIVLLGAASVTRAAREEEIVLLKTLGASRRQVLQITAVEYGLLGLLAALAGVLLASGSATLLAIGVFETTPVHPFGVLLAALLGASGLTLGIGLLGNRQLYSRPLLDVLHAAG